MNYTPQQQIAIDTIHDNLQIIACAGSGKTQVISQRIINILKQGNVEAKYIIAFTYTEQKDYLLFAIYSFLAALLAWLT